MGKRPSDWSDASIKTTCVPLAWREPVCRFTAGRVRDAAASSSAVGSATGRVSDVAPRTGKR
jgi:hypothetical protein